MLKLGNQNISAIHLGGTEIRRAYLGADLVFDGAEPPAPVYTITVAVDPAGSGTVSGAGSYQAGESVTVTATPGEGYTFIAWQQNGVTVSGDAVYTFVVNGDRSLTAVFEAVKTSRLPDGYTEVEYVESTGKLNYKASKVSIPGGSADGKIYVKFQVLNWAKFLTGRYGSEILSTYSGSTFYNYLRASSDSLGWWTTSVSYIDKATPFPTTVQELEINTSNLTCVYRGQTATLRSISAADSLSLFDNVDSSEGIRIYSVKIYKNGALNSELIPCKNSAGTIGFYELLSGTFLSPASSSFANAAAGPAV